MAWQHRPTGIYVICDMYRCDVSLIFEAIQMNPTRTSCTYDIMDWEIFNFHVRRHVRRGMTGS